MAHIVRAGEDSAPWDAGRLTKDTDALHVSDPTQSAVPPSRVGTDSMFLGKHFGALALPTVESHEQRHALWELLRRFGISDGASHVVAMYVIDTNIVLADPSLSSVDWTCLRVLATLGPISVVVPEFVVLAVARRHNRDLKRHLPKVRRRGD